ERERRRLHEERRLAPAGRRDHELTMRVRRADDDQRLDGRIVDERQRIVVVFRRAEFFGDVFCQRSNRIRHRRQARFRDAARKVARVHAAEPPEPNQSNSQASLHFTWSLVTSSSLTLMSPGIFSPCITFTALSTAARPISDGNCATDASIVPAAIALLASSSASNPMTRIFPVFPAARIASIAPSAIRSLHAKTLSISGWACSMFWKTLNP